MCHELVVGMRWKCQTCDDTEDSLCTECYMSGKHIEDDHKFSVIVEPFDRLVEFTFDFNCRA